MKKESRYKIKRELGSQFFDVYEGDNKLAGFLSRSNAEAAIKNFEAADKRRERQWNREAEKF